MIEEPEYVAELRDALEDARQVRDQWCAEYAKLRDELKPQILRIMSLVEQIAIGLGIKV